MVNTDAEKVEVERTLRRIEAAENQHDTAGVLQDTTEDHVVHLCGLPPVQGQEAVRQLFDGLFKTFVSTRITSHRVEVATSGDVAWDCGAYVNEYEGPQGRTREEGKYLAVYRKVEGKWKAAAFSITNNG